MTMTEPRSGDEMGHEVTPEIRCPHGHLVQARNDGSATRDVCLTCASPFAEMREALERIRAMTGDARVRRIADRALDTF